MSIEASSLFEMRPTVLAVVSLGPILADRLTVIPQGASLASHIEALVAAIHISSMCYQHLHPSLHNHGLCLVTVMLLHGLQVDLGLGMAGRTRGPMDDFGCLLRLIVD